MKLAQDVSLIAATAILTALLAGPLLGPGTADAVDEAAQPSAPAAVPVLSSDGYRLSLTLDRESYEPGQAPVVLFKAVNGGDRTAQVEARVRMKTLDPGSRASRMPPRPTERFSESISLKLAPGETKILRLPTEVKLEAGSTSLFEIESGKAQVLAKDVTLPLLDDVPFAVRGRPLPAEQAPETTPRGALRDRPLSLLRADYLVEPEAAQAEQAEVEEVEVEEAPAPTGK